MPMLPNSLEYKEKSAWQVALSDVITDPAELFTLLELNPDSLDQTMAATQSFALKVPRGFVKRMQKGNWQDPLLKQVLPLGVELTIFPDFHEDPLHEKQANPLPGLLHKYRSRVLVTLTSHCAIHCRYCFRRHFPYADNKTGTKGWGKIIDYIQQDTSINEVILSGGDPLTVSDKLLEQLTEPLTLIPHLKRLRIHTRLPVVLPERITSTFIEWINHCKLDLIMVIHANHPQEINDEVTLALKKLQKTKMTLLNQSVLLKSINDDIHTLTLLSEKLFSAGVLPYYLHVLDKIQGAAHFDLDLAQAKKLYRMLSEQLPGYLLPRLVCEEPGKGAKTLLID